MPSCRDLQTFIFSTGKAEASFLMKRNQRKISWTMFYRRLHKKGLSEDVSKKRTVRRHAACQAHGRDMSCGGVRVICPYARVLCDAIRLRLRLQDSLPDSCRSSVPRFSVLTSVPVLM